MAKLLKNKLFWLISVAIAAVVLVIGINQAIYVDNAHKSFESYYKFRGCTRLIKRTPTYGLCRTPGGVIKIVLFHGKWYLDGDLPGWFF